MWEIMHLGMALGHPDAMNWNLTGWGGTPGSGYSSHGGLVNWQDSRLYSIGRTVSKLFQGFRPKRINLKHNIRFWQWLSENNRGWEVNQSWLHL